MNLKILCPLIIVLVLLLGIGVFFLVVYWIILCQPKMKKDETGFSGPIDLVYTWVDGHDEAWREAQRQWRIKEGLPPGHPNRDPTPNLAKDELYFSLHQVLHFMPWLNRIYIFTQSPQTPHWLNLSHPLYAKVRVVHHEDVFAHYAPLPSYSGILNYSQLHHIPGLSEHFILFDDDQFVGRPIEPRHFFDAEGRPVYSMEIPWLIWGSSMEYSNILKTTHRLVKKYFGHWMVGPRHDPIPLHKSESFALERRLIDDAIFVKGKVPRFRDGKRSVEFALLVMNGILAKKGARRHHSSFQRAFVVNNAQKALKSMFAKQDLPHLFTVNQGFDSELAKTFEEKFRHVGVGHIKK